jgi:uncharacterized delta-60 repeat protein
MKTLSYTKRICSAAIDLILIALLMVYLWPQPQPARAANGDLDRSFGGYGTGGRMLSDPFPGNHIADAVTTADGKLIAVGSDGKDIVVARYDAEGKLDSTFGVNNGVTILDFDGRTDFASAVNLDYRDGKILVAGTTRTGLIIAPTADFAVARLHADGKPDLSFSQDGKTTVDFKGRADYATAVLPYPYPSDDKKLMVAGTVEQNPSGFLCNPSCNSDFGFVRINGDGSLDSTFGIGGKVQNDFGGDDTPLAVVFSGNAFYAAGHRIIGATSEYVIAYYQYGKGDLIKTFNGTGYRIGSSPSSLTALLPVGVYGADEVVAAGSVGGDFDLLRFKPNGSLDPTWGNNGLLTIDFGGDDAPHRLFELTFDTYAVIGASGTRLATARVTDKGQIVPNTALTTDLSDTGAASVRALAVTQVPDVRLLTIGSIKAGSTAQLAMARYFLAGVADDGGRQATNFSVLSGGYPRKNNDRAKAAGFQPDGKLLVAGHTNPTNGPDPQAAALARYTTAGALDSTFDGDGLLTLASIPVGASDIALQPDGKILVAGSVFDVARLNPNGSPDMSFNGSGKATVNIANGYSTAMALQADGKIVLAGSTSSATSSTFVLARFTAAGLPDTSFGLDGIQRIGFGAASAATDVAIQPDGKIIAAGLTTGGGANLDFALMRLNPADGSLDMSFDGDGKQTAEFDSADAATAVAIQPDGKIVAAGVSLNNGAAFARYLTDGTPDKSFDEDGKLVLPVSGNDSVRALDVSAGGITAAICDGNDTAGLVVRLKQDGKPDSSINGNGRLPFRFGGTDCPYGLASTEGRIAVVGYGRKTPPAGSYDTLTEDFAVAMYENVATPKPAPNPTPTPNPMPTPTGGHKVYMPLVVR